jgi:hypothetical protein
MRSLRPSVRNPVTALPAAQRLAHMPPMVRAELRRLFKELARESRANADKAWRKHKAPMAAYWKACAVYARHISVVLR